MRDLLERLADMANYNMGLDEEQQKTLHEAIGRIKVLESHYRAIVQASNERTAELNELKQRVEDTIGALTGVTNDRL